MTTTSLSASSSLLAAVLHGAALGGLVAAAVPDPRAGAGSAAQRTSTSVDGRARANSARR